MKASGVPVLMILNPDCCPEGEESHPGPPLVLLLLSAPYAHCSYTIYAIIAKIYFGWTLKKKKNLCVLDSI